MLNINIHLLSALGIFTPVWANSFPGSDPTIENRTIDQIYAAAQLESGELTVSWGGDEDSQGDDVRTAWAQSFPNIPLNLTVDLSKYHDSNIDRSWQLGGEYVDVAVLQTLHDFPRWKSQGRLLPYKPAVWENIWSSVKDSQGNFLPIAFYNFGSIIYNPGLVSAATIPQSYADFILPVWKGKLVLTYPNDDDAIAYLFSMIIGKYGWSWFETLAHHQDVQWVRGTATPGAVLARNWTSSATFTTMGVSQSLAQIFLPNDQFMSWAQTAAIFSSTKRPESSKLFISWISSDAFQKPLADSGSWSSRNDIPSGPNKTSIFESKLTEPIGFNKFMLDRGAVEWWRLQYETILGPAQGISPLHDQL